MVQKCLNAAAIKSGVVLRFGTFVQYNCLNCCVSKDELHAWHKVTQWFIVCLGIESHAVQVTFGPGLCTTKFIMEETCSVCERVTKYKCMKCKVSVCALCAPETAQTMNEVEYWPMKWVEVYLTCQQLQRPERDNEDDDTMPRVAFVSSKSKHWTQPEFRSQPELRRQRELRR